MRPVLHSDVVAAARVLLALPAGLRRNAMLEMIMQANVADVFRKRLKRGHPDWGNGSLMEVAMKRKMLPEPFLDDPVYCRCLMQVFEALLIWRGEQSAFNRPKNLSKSARLGRDQIV